MTSRFELSGLAFSMEKAHLEPFFSDEPARLVWQVHVTASGRPPACFDEGPSTRPWRLGLVSDPGELLHTGPGELGSWLDLAGREGGWQEREDEHGEPHASLDLFEQVPIYDCRWRLSAFDDRLHLSLKGMVDPLIGEGWMEGLALTVDTPLEMAPIPFGRASEAKCRECLVRFGLRDEFEFRRDEFGISQLFHSSYNPD